MGTPPAAPRTVSRTVTLRAEDLKDRTVALAFSSETPVKDFPFEPAVVFLHEEGAADLESWRQQGSVLLNHNADRIVGAPVSVSLDQRARKGRATVRLDEDEEGEAALRKVRGGSLRGVSARFGLEQVQRLDEGDMWTSPEGRRFEGPLLVVNRWTLQEVSLTPLPADAAVGVGRSRRRKEVDENTQDQNDVDERPSRGTRREPGSARGERERVRELIQVARAGRVPTVELDEWLDDPDFGPEDARRQVLDRMVREERAVTRPGHYVEVGDDREGFITRYSRGCLARANLLPKAELEKGEIERLSMGQLAERCLRRAGLSTRGSTAEVITRALQHSTSDFPSLLENTANKSLGQGYSEARVTWPAWSGTGSLPDFKTASRVAVGDTDAFEIVQELMPITQTTMSEKKETRALQTWAKAFGISRQALINDDLGEFTRIPQRLGGAAARTINNQVYAQLTGSVTMAEDSTALFSASHPSGSNLTSPGAAPSITELGKGLLLMRKQKTVGLRSKMNIAPAFLVAPAALEGVVRQLLQGTIVPAQTSNAVPSWMMQISPVIEPLLDDSSAVIWYLAASPTELDTVTVEFLNGQQTPTLLTVEGTSVLGREYVAYIDFNVKTFDHRGLYKNAGA